MCLCDAVWYHCLYSPLHSLSPRLSLGGTSLCSPAWRGFKWVTFETITDAPARTNAEWWAAAPGSWCRRLLELPVDYIDPLKQWGPTTLIVEGELINNNVWINALGFLESWDLIQYASDFGNHYTFRKIFFSVTDTLTINLVEFAFTQSAGLQRKILASQVFCLLYKRSALCALTEQFHNIWWYPVRNILK